MLGYKVMISDREKTAIDCIDRPALAGGVGEAAIILATASRRFDWTKAADYLERIDSALSCGGLAGSSITSRPICRRRCASVCCALAGRRPESMARSPTPERKVPGAIGYDKTWRLFVNVTREELHGSAGLGRRKTVRKES